METRNGLSTRARADARAFAEAFFARGDALLPSERLDYFERELSDFFGHVGGRARLLFLACLWTATWCAPLLISRPMVRLASLSRDERIAALEVLERVPVAQLALYALKAIASIVYYEHPDAAAEIGWDRRCLGNKALPVITERA